MRHSLPLNSTRTFEFIRTPRLRRRVGQHRLRRETICVPSTKMNFVADVPSRTALSSPCSSRRSTRSATPDPSTSKPAMSAASHATSGPSCPRGQRVRRRVTVLPVPSRDSVVRPHVSVSPLTVATRPTVHVGCGFLGEHEVEVQLPPPPSRPNRRTNPRSSSCPCRCSGRMPPPGSRRIVHVSLYSAHRRCPGHVPTNGLHRLRRRRADAREQAERHQHTQYRAMTALH